VLSKQVAEACGVEDGARTEDAGRRQPRELVAGITEDVDWVGGNQEQGFGIVLDDFRHDIAKDRQVAIQQLQSCLTWPLCRTGGYDHHGGTAAIFIVISYAVS